MKVLDFGVAKLARDDEGSLNGEWTVEPVTAVGTVVGSAPYISPEQIVGGDADSRSDVFSLGVVIYEMATGQLPFSGSTAGGNEGPHPARGSGNDDAAQP